MEVKCSKRLEGWRRLHLLNKFRRSRKILDAAADWLDKEISDLENWLMKREVKTPVSLIPATAQLNMDGQELIMISTALAEKANALISRGNPYEGEHHLQLAIKVRKIREDFHNRHLIAFSKRYGLQNAEKSAGRQTSLGHVSIQ